MANNLDNWGRTEKDGSFSIENKNPPKCRHCKMPMVVIKQTIFSFPLRCSKIGEVIKDADAYAIDYHFACPEHGYTQVHGVPITKTSFNLIIDGVLQNDRKQVEKN